MALLFDRFAASVSYRFERLARKHIEACDRRQLTKQLRLDPSTSLVAGELKKASILSAYGDRFARLVDIGAHEGKFSSLVASVFDLDEVLCVEPNEALHAELKSRAPSRAKLVSEAIDLFQGDRTFYLHPDSSMNSLLAPGRAFASLNKHYLEGDIHSQLVATRTLDSLISELSDHDTPNILLKVDVQGNEMNVIRSGPEFLKLVTVLVIEHMFWEGYTKTYSLKECVSLLEDSGFLPVGILDVQSRANITAFADFLFVRADGPIDF